MRYVLIGNYGAWNAGDEFLREYFVTRFPEIQWTVVSAQSRAGEVPRLPIGIRSFFLTPWWRTIKAIATSDKVVFGGGSLFTDIESSKACFLWGLHALVAFFFRKPVFLAFQGIGPFEEKAAERITRYVVKKAAFVSVRDEQSAARVREWGRGDVFPSFDPVALLFPERGDRPLGNAIALIPRWNSGQKFIDAAQWIQSHVLNGSVRIISMQPDAKELQTCAMLAQKFSMSDIRKITTMRDIIEALSDAGHIVTERYHGAIAGFFLGIPLAIVSQTKGDKLDEFLRLSQEGLKPSEFRSLALAGETHLRDALLVKT